MRRIVMFNRVSADGFFAAADGNLDWVVPDAEVDKRARRHPRDGHRDLRPADVRACSRRSGRTCWTSRRRPIPTGRGDLRPRCTPSRALLNDMTKLVFSKTLKEATWKNSRLRRELDPRANRRR